MGYIKNRCLDYQAAIQTVDKVPSIVFFMSLWFSKSNVLGSQPPFVNILLDNCDRLLPATHTKTPTSIS